MNTYTKPFNTLTVATLVTDCVMVEGLTYSDIADLASHLFGGPGWAVWMPEFMDQCEAIAREQFPDLPGKAEARADLKAAAQRALDAYGDVVEVRAGKGIRPAHPGDTAMEAFGRAIGKPQ